ncbi:MAG: transposase [Methylococcales bacterium]
MSIPFKSSPVEFNQHLLFPTNIFDLLAKDHECYLYADLFQQIDTSSLENLYSVKGQHAYHPKLIVSILIYAYSHGVFSSRQIEKRCNEDLSFMFIAQMNCPTTECSAISEKTMAAFFRIALSKPSNWHWS